MDSLMSSGVNDLANGYVSIVSKMDEQDQKPYMTVNAMIAALKVGLLITTHSHPLFRTSPMFNSFVYLGKRQKQIDCCL